MKNEIKRVSIIVMMALVVIITSCGGSSKDSSKIRKLLVEGKLVEAENYAVKNDCRIEFQEAFAENLGTLLRDGRYDDIFPALSAWKFESQYYEESEYVWNDRNNPKKEAYKLGNGEYNAEAQKFNDIVDAVLKNALTNHDMVNARKCLSLYVPYSEAVDVIWKNIPENLTHQLNNTARIAAANRIALIEQMGGLQDAFNAVQFEQGSAVLNAEAKKVLVGVGDLRKNNEDAILNIVGHTSSEGDDSTNQRLSEQRAKAAVEYLISIGVDSSRLQYEGKGSSQLKDPNNPTSSVNRRTEFILL